MQRTHPKPPSRGRLPRYGAALPAGSPQEPAAAGAESLDLFEWLAPYPESTFLIQVRGDSMAGAHIPDGATVVVDRSLKARSGSIVVALLDGEFTLKRLVRTPRAWVLHPENPAYRPVEISEEHPVEIWGVVRKVILDPSRL